MKHIGLIFLLAACIIAHALELEVQGKKLLVVRDSDKHMTTFITPSDINANSTTIENVILATSSNYVFVQTDSGFYFLHLNKNLEIDRILPACVCKPFEHSISME